MDDLIETGLEKRKTRGQIICWGSNLLVQVREHRALTPAVEWGGERRAQVVREKEE